jgi:hypothetical protein
MLSLADIDREIAAAEVRVSDAKASLKALRSARAAAIAARRAAILADFDAGMRNQEIADKHSITYGHVAQTLCDAGRTRRQRGARGLSPEQLKHYDLALRCDHVSIPAARAIALEVAP